MNNRIQLQKELEKIPNVKKVYFQPPATVKLKYPCIIYSLGRPKDLPADNTHYFWRSQYTVMIIDPNPDSQIYMDILWNFDHASFERCYASDNLYHYILNLYY